MGGTDGNRRVESSWSCLLWFRLSVCTKNQGKVISQVKSLHRGIVLSYITCEVSKNLLESETDFLTVQINVGTESQSLLRRVNPHLSYNKREEIDGVNLKR